MAFVRSWMSDALRAGLAGLAVPVALVAVLAVLGLSGAFGGLGSLGQVVVGPQVPLTSGGPTPRAPGAATTATQLPTIPGPKTSGGAAAPRSASSLPNAGPRSRQAPTVYTHPRNPARRYAPGTGRHPHPAPSASGPSTPSTPTPRQPPPPPPQRKPDPTQQLISEVQHLLPSQPPPPKSPSDAIGTVQQLTSSTSGPTATTSAANSLPTR